MKVRKEIFFLAGSFIGFYFLFSSFSIFSKVIFTQVYSLWTHFHCEGLCSFFSVNISGRSSYSSFCRSLVYGRFSLGERSMAYGGLLPTKSMGLTGGHPSRSFSPTDQSDFNRVALRRSICCFGREGFFSRSGYLDAKHLILWFCGPPASPAGHYRRRPPGKDAGMQPQIGSSCEKPGYSPALWRRTICKARP